MTDEDRQIFQAMLDAAVQSFDSKLDTAVQSLTAKQDAAIQSVAINMSEFRDELKRSMVALEKRFEVQAPVIFSLDSRMTAFTRSLDQLIVAHHEREDILAAQRRLIDQLKARMKDFEDRARGNQ
jgi:hypothetical protein